MIFGCRMTFELGRSHTKKVCYGQTSFFDSNSQHVISGNCETQTNTSYSYLILIYVMLICIPFYSSSEIISPHYLLPYQSWTQITFVVSQNQNLKSLVKLLALQNLRKGKVLTRKLLIMVKCHLYVCERN